MKNHLTIYTNIRFNICVGLAIIALILACDEADHTLAAFILIKGTAAAITAATYLLAKHWYHKGHFDNLAAFCDDED